MSVTTIAVLDICIVVLTIVIQVVTYFAIRR